MIEICGQLKSHLFVYTREIVQDPACVHVQNHNGPFVGSNCQAGTVCRPVRSHHLLLWNMRAQSHFDRALGRRFPYEEEVGCCREGSQSGTCIRRAFAATYMCSTVGSKITPADLVDTTSEHEQLARSCSWRT